MYKIYKISFTDSSNNLVKLSEDGPLKLYKKVLDWLITNGYDFKGVIHKPLVRRLFTKSEIEDFINKTSYNLSGFYNIKNSDKYILTSKGNVDERIRNIVLMLKNFGIDPKTIKFEGFDKKSTVPLHNDLEEPKKYGFRLNRFKASQAQEERPMEDIKKFKAIQAQEEREDFFNYSKNSFSQAICVLGESGSGKSTTIDNILDKSNNNYQYIIPSASTTGLLSQYSPSSGYIPSRLGNMIESAYKNPKSLYTAVFDECHKTNIIEMINDELLQAISKNRNRGVRFISLDEDTKNLYPSAKFDRRGNILIPDNLGFIFISSNARVISGNPDFFNRVDLVEITESDRNIKTIDELNSRRLVNNEDKKELVNKILGKYNDL